jgi:hypothetical protein
MQSKYVYLVLANRSIDVREGIVLDSIETIVALVAAHEFKQRSPVGVLPRCGAKLGCRS